MEWEINNNFMFFNNTNKTHQKYACFDLDGTIITTKSNKKFPIDKKDWKFTFKTNQNIIQELFNNKYNIVIITNQSGLKRKENGITEWKDKMNNIIQQLNVPVIVYVSLNHDFYRKPCPTFWKLLTKDKKVNYKKSFYCGDACGRENDFSDSDLKFALNCNLIFYTPEYLLNDGENLYPKVNYPINFDILQKEQTNNYIFHPKEKEIIIIVGIPGSGKSSFIQKYIKPHNYEVVNRDTLKTMIKCVQECNKYLKLNKSIIIDNTNQTVDSREKFIELAKKYNYTCRCIVIDIDINLAKHNTYFRHYNSDGKHNFIPEIVYNKYKKIYEPPQLKEGFKKIDIINFNFDTSYVNENYYLFYLSK
jgi:bifunctional polynucleotide phosphatase/kinase